MTVWEIVILMVMATVCVSCGIGLVYSSIVNTVERYQIRKSKRELEVFTKVIGEIPGMFKKIIGMVEEKEQERNKKYENEFAKKIRELDFEKDE